MFNMMYTYMKLRYDQPNSTHFMSVTPVIAHGINKLGIYAMASINENVSEGTLHQYWLW